MIKQFAPENKESLAGFRSGQDGCLRFSVSQLGHHRPLHGEIGHFGQEIFEYCNNEDQKTLLRKHPFTKCSTTLWSQTPGPIDECRIPNIWNGDLNSEIGKAMVSCDPDAELAMMVLKFGWTPCR